MKSRFRLNDLKLFYQIINELVPISLPPYITFAEASQFRYTRNTAAVIEGSDTTTLISSIVPSCDTFSSSYFYRTMKMWNSLPVDIRQAGGISVFKSKLMEYLWTADTSWPD